MLRLFSIFSFACCLIAGCNASSVGSSDSIVYLDLDKWNQADYSDTREINALWDVMHVTSSLQGIVNREAPRLFINYVRESGISIDEYWFEKYRAPGMWLEGRDTLRIEDPVEAAAFFRKEIKGLVVYDTNIASTSNIASTIAGVEDLIAVRYDTSEGSMYCRLTAMGFRPKIWLVNKDGTSKFKSKTEPYLWAIDKYLRTGRCNAHFAAYYIDQYWRQACNSAAHNHHQLTNHDFFISKKAFFFDLSPWDDETATDDPQGQCGEDLEVLKEILHEIYNLNKGVEFCHIGGFPAWAFKYTNHGNVGGKHHPVATEWEFAKIISAYNAYKDADAISYGAMANASFWQHFPLKDKYPQKWTTRDELKQKGYLTSDGMVNPDKKYILMYVGDFDASAWIYQLAPSLWDNPDRGKVPLMWSISPVLAERAPMVMDYFWTTASEMDYFAAADNGAGYLNPGMLESPREVSGLPDAMEAWGSHCKPYYERWGLTITGFIIDGSGPGMTEKGFKCYSEFSPNGIVPQNAPPGALVNGMPVMRAGADANYENPDDAAKAVLKYSEDHPSFPFYWYRAIIKTPSWYISLKDKLEEADKDIVWMTAPDYFELLRCYLEEGHGTENM